MINGSLLALSALFAFGARPVDVYGRRRIAVFGVAGFAPASACWGLTPQVSLGKSSSSAGECGQAHRPVTGRADA